MTEAKDRRGGGGPWAAPHPARSKTEPKKKISCTKHFWEHKATQGRKNIGKKTTKNTTPQQDPKTRVRPQKWISEAKPKKRKFQALPCTKNPTNKQKHRQNTTDRCKTATTHQKQKFTPENGFQKPPEDVREKYLRGESKATRRKGQGVSGLAIQLRDFISHFGRARERDLGPFQGHKRRPWLRSTRRLLAFRRCPCPCGSLVLVASMKLVRRCPNLRARWRSFGLHSGEGQVR